MKLLWCLLLVAINITVGRAYSHRWRIGPKAGSLRPVSLGSRIYSNSLNELTFQALESDPQFQPSDIIWTLPESCSSPQVQSGSLSGFSVDFSCKKHGIHIASLTIGNSSVPEEVSATTLLILISTLSLPTSIMSTGL
jgi:hypothetical protein